MKSKDLAKKDKVELTKMIEDKKKSLQEFRFAREGSKMKNVRESRNTRKDIARIYTALRAQ